MNITQVKYFIEIAKCHSISEASRNLFVTQPTLSLALKKLETELNCLLISRNESGLELTAAGKILYDEGQVLISHVDKITQQIHNLQNQKDKNPIRLGMTTLFAIQFAKELALFTATHQNVVLTIIQDGSRLLQQMLANQELDIGLLSYPNYEADKITIEALHTSTKGYQVYVVVPKSNPLAQHSRLSFDDLKDQVFSSLTEDYMLGIMLAERAEAHGFKPNILSYYTDLQAMLHSLNSSNTICLMAIEYKHLVPLDNLVWIPLDDKSNYFSIGIALNKSIKPSQNILDFIDILKQN